MSRARMVMIREGFRPLHGFAWHVRRRTGTGRPGSMAYPSDGVGSTYRPQCWPISPEESGVRKRVAGPAFLVIMPTLSFGAPEVGRGWEVEPVEFDGFRTADGRVRLVGRERHRTRWETVAECEFEEKESRPRESWDLAKPLDGLPDRDTAVSDVPGEVVMTDSAAA